MCIRHRIVLGGLVAADAVVFCAILAGRGDPALALLPVLLLIAMTLVLLARHCV